MAVNEAMMKARIDRCDGCDQRWNCKRWGWPRCAAGGMDEAGLPSIVLDSAAMNADAPVCPLGFWDKLTPVDLAVEEQAKLERQTVLVSDWAQDPMLARLTDAQAAESMVAYVERGHMTPDFAEALLLQAKGIGGDYIAPALDKS